MDNIEKGLRDVIRKAEQELSKYLESHLVECTSITFATAADSWKVYVFEHETGVLESIVMSLLKDKLLKFEVKRTKVKIYEVEDKILERVELALI